MSKCYLYEFKLLLEGKWIFFKSFAASKSMPSLLFIDFSKPLPKHEYLFYSFQGWPYSGAVSLECSVTSIIQLHSVILLSPSPPHNGASGLNTSTAVASSIPTNLGALPGTERRRGRCDVLVHAGNGAQRGIHILQLLLQLLSSVIQCPKLLFQRLHVTLLSRQLDLRG